MTRIEIGRRISLFRYRAGLIHLECFNPGRRIADDGGIDGRDRHIRAVTQAWRTQRDRTAARHTGAADVDAAAVQGDAATAIDGSCRRTARVAAANDDTTAITVGTGIAHGWRRAARDNTGVPHQHHAAAVAAGGRLRRVQFDTATLRTGGVDRRRPADGQVAVVHRNAHFMRHHAIAAAQGNIAGAKTELA